VKYRKNLNELMKLVLDPMDIEFTSGSPTNFMPLRTVHNDLFSDVELGDYKFYFRIPGYPKIYRWEDAVACVDGATIEMAVEVLPDTKYWKKPWEEAAKPWLKTMRKKAKSDDGPYILLPIPAMIGKAIPASDSASVWFDPKIPATIDLSTLVGLP
jgi:hypothetical protein